MPFRAQNKQDPFKGLIRTHLLKEDIRNMEATHLLAKLNRIPLGVFHSGIMTADFTTSSSGSGNPHAEENLISGQTGEAGREEPPPPTSRDSAGLGMAVCPRVFSVGLSSKRRFGMGPF